MAISKLVTLESTTALVGLNGIVSLRVVGWIELAHRALLDAQAQLDAAAPPQCRGTPLWQGAGQRGRDSGGRYGSHHPRRRIGPRAAGERGCGIGADAARAVAASWSPPLRRAATT